MLARGPVETIEGLYGVMKWPVIAGGNTGANSYMNQCVKKQDST